jgi:hypothetical protein
MEPVIISPPSPGQNSCHILLERFPDTQTSDPMDQLQMLKQTSTLEVYIDAYENWTTLMKRGRAYLPADFFVDRFVSGLKDTIKHNVQCQKPTTLYLHIGTQGSTRKHTSVQSDASLLQCKPQA